MYIDTYITILTIFVHIIFLAYHSEYQLSHIQSVRHHTLPTPSVLQSATIQARLYTWHVMSKVYVCWSVVLSVSNIAQLTWKRLPANTNLSQLIIKYWWLMSLLDSYFTCSTLLIMEFCRAHTEEHTIFCLGFLLGGYRLVFAVEQN
jgi:hypothetical protein